MYDNEAARDIGRRWDVDVAMMMVDGDVHAPELFDDER